MMTSAFLCIDRHAGEQVVRSPRPTDAVGQALRGAIPAGAGLPEDILALLTRLDRADKLN